jgi:hypothetical protein
VTVRPILWTPHPGPQSEFLAASEFEVLYGGAAGGGKTDALIFDGVGQMNHPAARAVFLRQTFPQLREVMDRCAAIFPQLGGEWRASDKRWRFTTGATFEFGYGQTWDEVQQYAGQEFTWLGYDEIGNLKEERCWTFLHSRLRSKDKSLKVYARASANPGGAGHAWLKRRFVEATNQGQVIYRDKDTGLTRRFIAAKVKDNPSLIDANPQYIAQLMQLPETLRKQLLEGDWNTGAGFALSELGETSHLVQPFDIPAHWYRFGGFDWGFEHPWWMTGAAQAPNGDVFVTHAIKGRRDQPDQIASSIVDGTRGVNWGAIAGGLDAWHDHKARGESGPTIAERLQAAGIPLVRATVSRVSGLNNLRWYCSLTEAVKNKATGLYDLIPRVPRVRFFDTPSCRALVSHLRDIVTDPDRPEDSLKVDADPETGLGGDDGYDTFRYMMMLRPYSAEPVKVQEPLGGNVSTGKDPLVIPPLEPEIVDAIDGGQYLGET